MARDFHVEDVWALPTPGGPGDFPRLVEMVTSLDPAQTQSPLVRSLFAVRWKLGGLLGWDEPATGLGGRVPTLRDRLPADLRGEEPDLGFDPLPFAPLYLTDDELAAETANKTVHGVLHLGWVQDGARYRGQLAILVKRNGLLGAAYMAAITPFRHLIVYPTMMRELGHAWDTAAAES